MRPLRTGSSFPCGSGGTRAKHGSTLWRLPSATQFLPVRGVSPRRAALDPEVLEGVSTPVGPGSKLWACAQGKAVILVHVGAAPISEGMNILGAHIDSPRLDIKQNPLYEDEHLAYLDTHYYGGIKKYQWTAIPLALHGVIYRADGTKVNVCIGEKDDDPVFCITDLLPHLGAKQSAKTLAEGIAAEDLNVIIASLPIEDKDAEQRVKLNVLGMLNEAYGITERDFTRAEIEVVPAYKARDIGLDRAMIGAYGHHHRVDALSALTG